jgi:negative regulator of sigma E activity
METHAYRIKETDEERQPRHKMQLYHLLGDVLRVRTMCSGTWDLAQSLTDTTEVSPRLLHP